MSEAEEKEILDKLIEMDAKFETFEDRLIKFQKEMNEGFNRMEKRFDDMHERFDSLEEIAEGILKKQ